jgi:hypothetical protein
MSKERLFPALTKLIILSVIVVIAVSTVIFKKNLIGPLIIALGFLPWLPLKLAGRDIHSVGADIIFGAIDTGIMAVGAIIGANFAGALGAIVGSVVGDSITDGLAGLFEGGVSTYLREHNIVEARIPLSSSWERCRAV